VTITAIQQTVIINCHMQRINSRQHCSYM